MAPSVDCLEGRLDKTTSVTVEIPRFDNGFIVYTKEVPVSMCLWLMEYSDNR